MGRQVSEELIERIGILAKLELSGEEKEKAVRDMGRMLDYVDCLNELDTDKIEPLSHVFPVCNAFREDIVAEAEDGERILANAPRRRGNAFSVPTAIEPAGRG